MNFQQFDYMNREHREPARPDAGSFAEAVPQASIWLIETGISSLDILLSILRAQPKDGTLLNLKIISDPSDARVSERPEHPLCTILPVGTHRRSSCHLVHSLSRRMAVIATGPGGDTSLIVDSTRMGASDFIEEPYSHQTVWKSVRKALIDDRHLAQRRSRLNRAKQCYRSLTPREREVLPLLTHGLLNKQAASVLGISIVTLQIHRGNIMRKMKASSFAELVRTSVELEALKHSPLAMALPSPC